MDEVTAIKNLKPFKISWCIQVKILHAWNNYTKGSGMSYEMILADENVTILGFTSANLHLNL